jgi:EAL domain-containing protein (putative c-di-GMP-specific phosphodiesterase class I)
VPGSESHQERAGTPPPPRDDGLLVIDATGNVAPLDLNTLANSDKSVHLSQRFSRMWEIPEDTLDRIRIENELRRALERDEFEVFLQPQAVVGTDQIVGAEALVRWRHPDRGLLLPGEFIPAAEESGLIVRLGEYVLRDACERAVHRVNAGMPPVRVAVNLSAVQFREPGLAALVSNTLDEFHMHPRMLELEITETTAMKHAELALNIMQDLKSLGVTMSLDDFGTGYSSLQYLRDFPIEALKIDQSFMRNVALHAGDRAIVSAVIGIGESLGVKVIAEGIETPAQLQFLKEHHCTWYQGFLLARPMPTDDFDSMLNKLAA